MVYKSETDKQNAIIEEAQLADLKKWTEWEAKKEAEQEKQPQGDLSEIPSKESPEDPTLADKTVNMIMEPIKKWGPALVAEGLKLLQPTGVELDGIIDVVKETASHDPIATQMALKMEVNKVVHSSADLDKMAKEVELKLDPLLENMHEAQLDKQSAIAELKNQQEAQKEDLGKKQEALRETVENSLTAQGYDPSKIVEKLGEQEKIFQKQKDNLEKKHQEQLQELQIKHDKNLPPRDGPCR